MCCGFKEKLNCSIIFLNLYDHSLISVLLLQFLLDVCVFTLFRRQDISIKKKMKNIIIMQKKLVFYF